VNAALMRLFGEMQQAVLIAANVENHQDIALAHIDQPVAPCAFLPAKMGDIGADDSQMCCHITGQRVCETATHQQQLAARIGHLASNFGQLTLGDMAKCFMQIFKRCIEHLRQGPVRMRRRAVGS